VTRGEAVGYVVDTLRRRVWLGGGDERNVSLDQPLGSDGLGLDSLGTVEFLAALEGSLNIRFPDEFWSRGARTLGDIVDFVADAARARTVAEHPPPAPHSPTPVAARSAGVALATEAIRKQGFLRGFRWTAARLAERYGRSIYARQHQLLLQRDFTGTPLPAPVAPPIPLEFRAATLSDQTALEGFWPPPRRDYWLRLFCDRIASGSHCFVALHAGVIVGIDWVSGKSADTALIGLTVQMRAGSCVGENLLEHRGHRGRGIGLALLVYSLDQARRLGYERQVTLVSAWNQRMLVTAIQLLGFRQIGEIATTWRLGKPRSAWHLDGTGESGVGGTLVI
jgi:acyl carrier protein/GNAT superfamily N-acetyltransferase